MRTYKHIKNNNGKNGLNQICTPIDVLFQKLHNTLNTKVTQYRK